MGVIPLITGNDDDVNFEGEKFFRNKIQQCQCQVICFCCCCCCCLLLILKTKRKTKLRENSSNFSPLNLSNNFDLIFGKKQD